MVSMFCATQLVSLVIVTIDLGVYVVRREGACMKSLHNTQKF